MPVVPRTVVPRSPAMIRAVTPLLIGAAGLVALVAGGLILRTFGAAYRIGRLLATAPAVTIAEANAMAAEGRRAYVRVAGRIDAEDEFEDEHHRPLVFRRVRLEARTGRGWRPFEDHRRAVPFTVNENQPSGYLSDSLEHLNYFAAGAPHGLQPRQPTEGLKRALELPAQWTSTLLSGDNYLGATTQPDKPVAYFETTPARPADTGCTSP